MEKWINKLDKPLMMPITRRQKENENVDTFFFEHSINSQAGQFVMMWIPGVDEKPFSIAYDTGTELGLAVAKVGPFTEELFRLKVGDKVGIRGPYGKGFWKADGAKKVVMVGGGYGVAPLLNIAEELVQDEVDIHFINGARSKDLLLFQDRLNNLEAEIYTTTNDGSHGIKGLVTDPIKEILKKEKIDLVYICGPELMEKAVFDICEASGINCQISIERYMKCGMGVCGACAVDGTGEPMCIKGPVVDSKTVRGITEFGKYHRSGSGVKNNF
ncbi:dihydroorotate dehydrogenase electron transfer subunit [Patescibacteria group bacterium]|nr:dihydroorotate dehydrogenase electron transfer subunit [Patescibacteria group bacterium]MBU1075008.1 dihydroorotate dehydrogenase electron transfer subunit [Patescibacteria group bacterium]MBU1952432.1 dihydroorotate dehydrogenase electron transfer subunit [Patescibacteria group bacterium]MBU2235949.1 dihydroorotate dehydrogenase electron transfer subunit [Patescibacteria group bacterium]